MDKFDILKPMFYAVGTEAEPNYRVVWKVLESVRAESAEGALDYAIFRGYVAPIVAPSSGDVRCGDFSTRCGPSGTTAPSSTRWTRPSGPRANGQRTQ